MRPFGSVPLADMLNADLYAHGREIGAPVKRRMTKADLIETIEKHLAQHRQVARPAEGLAVTGGGARRRAGGGAPRQAPYPGPVDPAGDEPEQEARTSAGGLLHEVRKVVGEKWKSVSIVTLVSGGALAVDHYFYRKLGAHGQLDWSDRVASVLRAWPLLAVALLAAVTVLLPLVVFIAWRRRAGGPLALSSYAWWIGTTGVTFFVVAFLLTSAQGAVKRATVHIQAGQEVSAVLAPWTGWPLYFSDAYYVEHVEFADQARQQKFEAAREPGEALTFVYLQMHGDADDKRVILYDHDNGEATSDVVVELCVGSRGAPGISIGCVR